MGDWIGLAFFVLLIAAALVGLKVLSKPKTRTPEEFERSASENKTMLGITLNALHGFTDPAAAKGRIVQEEMKEGRYQKKKREGKANSDTENDRDMETI